MQWEGGEGVVEGSWDRLGLARQQQAEGLRFEYERGLRSLHPGIHTDEDKKSGPAVKAHQVHQEDQGQAQKRLVVTRPIRLEHPANQFVFQYEV